MSNESTAPRAICTACSLGDFCYPKDLPARLSGLLPMVSPHRRRLAPGEVLFRSGEQQKAIYAVKSGCFQSTVPLGDGRNQTSSFAIIGDVLGLDAIGDGLHRSDTSALSAAEVCEIPILKFDCLLEHGESAVAARRMLGVEVNRAAEHAVSLAGLSARQRVAGFLVDFAQRWQARGFPADAFVLPMSRAELGNYLGLTAETVTRELTKLRNRNLITVSGKHVRIHDQVALREIRATPDKPAETRMPRQKGNVLSFRGAR